MAPTYLRAIGSALAEGLTTAAWVAAGELPKRRRRLVRAGTAASVVTVGALLVARDPTRAAAHDPDQTGTPESADSQLTESAQSGGTPLPLDARRIAVTVILGVVSIGSTIGRRRLEKRWLAQLQANGHEHPHRALAVRMGLLSVAVTLPRRLYAARDADRNSVDLERGSGSSVVR
jgi:hypothetical protein